MRPPLRRRASWRLRGNPVRSAGGLMARCRLPVPPLLALTLALALWRPAAPDPATVPIDHLIVIYMENRSFDHLLGLFPGAAGLANAAEAAPQTDRSGRVYPFLPPPLDLSLQPPRPDPRFPAALPNQPFLLDPYAPQAQRTSSPVHRYYRQQYQINAGRMDRFVTWSGVGGLVMGYYDMRGSQLWRWAEQYTLADRFFHAAFGGSMLNHFWLVWACTPYWPDPPAELVATPFPDDPAYMQDRPVRPDGYVVNDAQPLMPPHRPGIAETHRVPLQTAPHIGDRLDAAGISWAWYARGWNDVVAGRPHPQFPYHHQPFNYFANVGGDPTVRPLRLRDESDFLAALWNGTLPQVAWLKPDDTVSQHAADTNITRGDEWLGQMLEQIRASPYWPRVAVIVTYDENGGWWDHVAPPVIDEWGPGARVPTLIISPWARRGFVDHTVYDTTSILRFIEWRWNLPPLGPRDAQANNLLAAFDFTQPGALLPKQ